MFSRFDGEVVNPYDDVVHINFSGGECTPPQDLLLYKSTGNDSTGLHYDPIMISMRESARAQRGDCRAEEERYGACRKRIQSRSTASADCCCARSA